jgi:hypothetical protein
LNPRNRLTDGLIVACALTDGGTGLVWNAAQPWLPGVIQTAPGATYWNSGPEGFGYASTAGADYVFWGFIPQASPAPNPYTASVRCVMADLGSPNSNYGKMWGTWFNGPPYQNWGIFQQNGVVGASMGNINGPIDLYLDALPIGSVHTIVQTWDGTRLRGYIDGVFMDSVVISPTIGMVTGNLSIGANPNDSAEYWPAPVYEAVLWGRCLSAAEVLNHSRDPYGMFDTRSSVAIATLLSL